MSSVWKWPAIIAASSALGMGLALSGDGPVDMVSWFALALPVVTGAYFVARAYGARTRRTQ
ncbi:MAG: hypothetical protein AAF654_05945 [Myxococcota bacterium]